MDQLFVGWVEASACRAQTVRAILVQRGVDGSRIEAMGMGESEPVATNETADGRSQNRRVQMVLIGGRDQALNDRSDPLLACTPRYDDDLFDSRIERYS